MPNLRILGEDDVRAAINADTALDLARRTLKDQADGRSILSSPAAMVLDATTLGGPRFKFKAAAVGHLNASGIRLLSHPGPTAMKTCNYSAVYDHSGFLLSGLVSEQFLSRIRTAAFGAVAVEALANTGPVTVALFGTGGIAKEIVPMLSRVLNMAQLRVNSRREESMQAFVAEHAPTLGCPMSAFADGIEMVKDADVVIAITEARSPLVLPGTLKPGAVVCSMGSYCEVYHEVLLEAQRFIVDDLDFGAEMGSGGGWIRQGRMTREAFRGRVDALACEVIAGSKPGRLAASDRIVSIMQGMAIGDVAFAAYALREAEKLGRGTVVELP